MNLTDNSSKSQMKALNNLNENSKTEKLNIKQKEFSLTRKGNFEITSDYKNSHSDKILENLQKIRQKINLL